MEELTFNGERYEVKLPWKSSHPVSPDNYELSFRRLGGNLRGVRQHPEVMSEYDNVVREQMERGIIGEISSSNLAPAGKVHYLPYHAVLRINKETTKL